jgi:hypothetical protein
MEAYFLAVKYPMPEVAPVITTSLPEQVLSHFFGSDLLFLIIAKMLDHSYSLKYFANFLFFIWPGYLTDIFKDKILKN